MTHSLPRRDGRNRLSCWRGGFCLLRSVTDCGVVAVLCFASTPVLTQETSAGAASLSVVPSFGASTTYTEVRGSATEQQRIGADWVTQAGPGLQVNLRGARVQAKLDYVLLGTAHARRNEFNTVTNSLSSSLKADLVPGWAYLDANASIGQQGASVYGLQQTTSSLRAPNSLRQVSTVTVSPYVRGELGSWATYEVRATGAVTDVRKSPEGDSLTLLTSAVLRSSAKVKFGWGLQATQQRVDFRASRQTDIYRLIASATYTPDFDLLFTLRAGQETTNVGSVFRQTYNNWGAGVRWTPSSRTLVSLDADRRFFGNGHQVVVEQRQPRSTLRFSSIRDTTTSGDATGVGRPVTLFQLYMLQYTSIEPDVTLRELRVLELLRLTGQNPNLLVNGGIATSAVSLQRREDLSLSYTGLRTFLTAQIFSSTTQVIDLAAGQSAGQRIRQSGASVAASYRLTALASVNLGASYQRTPDPQPVQPANTLRTLTFSLTTTLGKSTTASLGARYSLYDGPPFSNQETALAASMNVRF